LTPLFNVSTRAFLFFQGGEEHLYLRAVFRTSPSRRPSLGSSARARYDPAARQRPRWCGDAPVAAAEATLVRSTSREADDHASPYPDSGGSAMRSHAGARTG
jgi:hypothetical protein